MRYPSTMVCHGGHCHVDAPLKWEMVNVVEASKLRMVAKRDMIEEVNQLRTARCQHFDYRVCWMDTVFSVLTETGSTRPCFTRAAYSEI